MRVYSRKVLEIASRSLEKQKTLGGVSVVSKGAR